MDEELVFRDVVASRCKPDPGFIRYKFTFDTVFYKSAHSYCCCKCAFEHEYFDYISENGDINEHMYERVADNISRGKCEHVDAVPRHYVRDTYVYGVHIAALFCADEEYWKVARAAAFRTCGIFELNVYATATLKNNYKGLGILCDLTVNINSLKSALTRQYLHAKSDENTTRTTVQLMTLLELNMAKRNVPMLKIILEHAGLNRKNIVSALTFAFSSGLEDLQNILMEHVKHTSIGKFENILFYAESAIVYDRPQVLEQLLQDWSLYRPYLSNWLKTTLVLGRSDCEIILLQHEKTTVSKPSTVQRVSKLLYLLRNFYDVCKDQVVSAFWSDLEMLDNINQQHPENGSEIHIYLNSREGQIDTRVLETLFDLGVDIDIVNKRGQTPLIYWLKNCRTCGLAFKDFYEILETLVNGNPSFDLNKYAVNLGLAIDASLDILFKAKELQHDYQMDGKTHTLIGDDSNIAMAFIGPYLIECGFPVQRDTVLDVIDSLSLASEELIYIQQHLDTPRRLMFKCRDVLRSYFKGQNIHKFVECSNIPKPVQDFILIQPHFRSREHI